jgi:hypothetical protein
MTLLSARSRRPTTVVEPVLLPPRSPNLTAYCERFVRSIKEAALGQMRRDNT